jgi:hypothetical protein
VRPDAWVAVPIDGEAAQGQPSTVEPGLEPIVLETGQTVTGWLEFELPAGSTDLFLDYQNPAGSTVFIVALF